MPTFSERKQPLVCQVLFGLGQCVYYGRVAGDPRFLNQMAEGRTVGEMHCFVFNPGKTHPFEKIHAEFLSQMFEKMHGFIDRTTARTGAGFGHILQR